MQRSWPKVALVALLLVGFCLRYHNFPLRIIFGPEQAISLLTSASYLQDGISTGQPYYRWTTSGHQLFYGPQFNYLLMPLLVIFDYQVVPITFVFLLINLLTGYLIYLFGLKYSTRLALVALFLFVVNALMINYSLFVWSLNLIPMLGILSLFALRKPTLLNVVLLGFYGSLGISFEYPYFVFSFLTLVTLMVVTRQKIRDLTLFLIGGVIGATPMILFELRNDFYLLRTLFEYATNQVETTTHTLDIFHFSAIVPLVTLVLAYLLTKLKPVFLIPLLGLYLLLNLNHPLVNFDSPTGHPEGISLPFLQQVALDAKPMLTANSNLIALYDFDTQAKPLQYLVNHRHNANYQDLETLLVLVPDIRDLSTPDVYELQSHAPYQVEVIKHYPNTHTLYRLLK